MPQSLRQGLSHGMLCAPTRTAACRVLSYSFPTPGRGTVQAAARARALLIASPLSYTLTPAVVNWSRTQSCTTLINYTLPSI